MTALTLQTWTSAASRPSPQHPLQTRTAIQGRNAAASLLKQLQAGIATNATIN